MTLVNAALTAATDGSSAVLSDSSASGSAAASGMSSGASGSASGGATDASGSGSASASGSGSGSASGSGGASGTETDHSGAKTKSGHETKSGDKTDAGFPKLFTETLVTTVDGKVTTEEGYWANDGGQGGGGTAFKSHWVPKPTGVERLRRRVGYAGYGQPPFAQASLTTFLPVKTAAPA